MRGMAATETTPEKTYEQAIEEERRRRMRLALEVADRVLSSGGTIRLGDNTHLLIIRALADNID